MLFKSIGTIRKGSTNLRALSPKLPTNRQGDATARKRASGIHCVDCGGGGGGADGKHRSKSESVLPIQQGVPRYGANRGATSA